MTKIKSAICNPQSAIWALLTILALFVYFSGLTLPFLGPDEARYAQVAREMMDRGDCITPTLGGFNWFEKPALLYWLEIVSYKIFGVSEFAARLGPALFGLGTVVSLWILGRSLATENTENTENTEENGTRKEDGKIANIETPIKTSALSVFSVTSVANKFPHYLALIAASTLGILVFSHGASFDIIITFPITAALVSFFIFDQRVKNPVAIARGSDKFRYLPLVLFYVFIGIALLAKGLIGIVFPFAIVAFYYVLSRRLPGRTFVISLIWGTLLACAIAALWYVPMYRQHGQQFIDEFFIQHHFQRFTSNKYQHPQPFYFFLWVLPLMTLPWLPFFFGGMWKMALGLFNRRDAETQSKQNTATFPPFPFSPFPLSPSSPLLLFSTSWLLVPLVFFSFSGSKLPGYILPAVPAAAIIAAVFIFGLVQRSRMWGNAVVLIAVLTFAVTILMLVFAMPRFAESDSVRTLIQTANERGYTSNRVLMLHTISHNAEFYAAGRLLRDGEGKQRKLNGGSEVRAEINAEKGAVVLILVPLDYISQLTKDGNLRTEVLTDNGELAIAAVSGK